MRQQNQLDKEAQPQSRSPRLSTSNLTVAQRRALFEPNIVTQQPSKKQIITTTVTISLTKTTPTTMSTTAANEATEESIEDVIKTPPRPIPCSASTPPSRRGARLRTGFPCLGDSSWIPPCIKNVLLKKKLINEMEDYEQLSDDSTEDKLVLTKYPFDKIHISGKIIIS